MRKNHPNSILSPRPRLQLKSPISRQKPKAVSPIHSYRPNRNRKSTLGQAPKPKIVWLPSPTLYSFFHPLQKTQGMDVTFRLTIGDKEKGQKIWVVSGIDSFIDTYMELNDQMKVECEKWYIISTAVNCKETESEFNSMYSPIQFVFSPNISSVCNSLLGFTNHSLFEQVEGIYDLSLASSSQFLCIEESTMENLASINQNCLYILNDAKQWMLFNARMSATVIPYFITGSQEFRDGKLCVREHRVKEKVKMIFICFQFERNLRQLAGFLDYQAKFRSSINCPQSISKLNSKNEVYLSKIVQKLLLPDLNNICIFYEPLSSPLLTLAEIRMKLNPAFFLLPSSLYQAEDNAYKLKYNTRCRSCQQLAINSTMMVEDQIKKIETFIDRKNKLVEFFMPHVDVLKKMQINCYSNQRNDRHCITSALQRCGIKVVILRELECLVETSKITLVYGSFTFDEMNSLGRFYNVFLVPLSKDPEEVATLEQIDEAHSFISVALKSYSQVYSSPATKPVEAFIHLLYEQETQLPGLLGLLSIQEHLLKTHYISNFQVELSQFRENSRHLIISPMDIFSEQLQSVIREFQWKHNTIAIELYLQYGQDFIYRNKEQSYKFIKASELQAKVTQLEQEYEQSRHKPHLPKDAEMNMEPNNLKLEGLEELDKMDISHGELDDFDNIMEESIVELYANNRDLPDADLLKQQPQMDSQKNEIQSHASRLQGESSLIQLLSESRIDLSNERSPIQEDIQEIGTLSQIIGLQTKELIKQSPHHERMKKDSLVSRPEEPNQIYDPHPNLGEQQQSKPPDVKPAFNRNRHRNSKEKAGIVRQTKQHKVVKVNSQMPAQLHKEIEELNQLKSTNSIGPEFYKLYIFIHRSVPLHSFARRHQKEYHILVYTRLEEILVFLRYLKPEEKVVVIANEQSQQIYRQLILKSKVNEGSLKIIFSKDLSENFIRAQVDKILQEERLEEAKQKFSPKKFRALVIYEVSNERVQKAIKIIRKIFGAQIKLTFLKQEEYEEMTDSKFQLKISPSVHVYKIGLPAFQGEISISSIRSLFVLAMHPDLKTFGFEFTNLYFSLEAYLARILYGNSQKNYGVSNKRKGGDSLKKKVQGMKSQSNFFRPRDSHMSYLKSQPQRRLSQTPRRSSVSKSSTLLRSTSSVSIIVSGSLKDHYCSKNTFYMEEDMLSHILIAYEASKLAIVVVSEQEFDTFELFQDQHFNQASKEVVWVIQTQIEGKQLFVGDNMVYSIGDNIKEAIETVISQYEKKLYFEELQVSSHLEVVRSGHYGQKRTNEQKSEYSRTLKLMVIGTVLEEQLHNLNKNRRSNTVMVTVGKQSNKRKFYRNLIELPSVESIKKFSEFLVRKFQHKKEMSLDQNFGSMLISVSSNMPMIKRAVETSDKKNVMFRAYDPSNINTMVIYSIMRVLVIVEKGVELRWAQRCPSVVEASNWQKIGRVIAAAVL